MESSKIKRALGFFDGLALDCMGINHCGSDIAVPQKLLNRADVVIGLQQMACKTVTKGMGCGPLIDFGFIDRALDGLLNMAFMEMVAPVFLGFRHKG